MADEDQMANIRERLGTLLRTGSAGDRIVELNVVNDVKAVVATGPDIAGQPVSPQDWTHTLDAVHRASDVLRAREERITTLENELNELRAESSETVAALQSHVASLQEQLASMDERRVYAEQWLRRLHEAVIEKLRLDDPSREESSRRAG
jgi:hypothetical protein